MRSRSKYIVQLDDATVRRNRNCFSLIGRSLIEATKTASRVVFEDAKSCRGVSVEDPV